MRSRHIALSFSPSSSYFSSNPAESKQEKTCCMESRRIGETMEQIDVKTQIVERVVDQLQITCGKYYDSVGLYVSSSYI
ncbi:hypothetical protein Y032_0656g1220 [Ancylostoma ceylanicum]|uniref:Uncharacterized protein n=1 Tax=Ancylostoma ceylanicum TaxID=53326 RepID=A0A016WIG4_9BILA|nr:hypothetical protein Y032_0656g1220 [Ancylostoma ceylanicum]